MKRSKPVAGRREFLTGSLLLVAAPVRDPPPRMPQLFPSPLSEPDITAVAAYVHSNGAPGSTGSRR